MAFLKIVMVTLIRIPEHQMAHVVEHVTRDSGGPCSNPGVGNHYFSHAVTFGVVTHLCKLELTSLQGRRSFKG